MCIERVKACPMYFPVSRERRTTTPSELDVAARIVIVRGHRVLLDEDLAAMYDVPTGRLNEAVGRNLARFPEDFMFRLTTSEVANLKSQIAISSSHGGRRSRPRAFTEQGVAMLSSVLRSPRAVAVNVEVVRTFVRLRRLYGEHAELSRRIDEIEGRFDRRFKVVFDAIRALQAPPPAIRRPIGFRDTRSS